MLQFDASDERLPDGWYLGPPLRDSRLGSLLQNGLNPKHPLYDVSFSVVGHRDASNEMLCRHNNKPSRFTVVQLAKAMENDTATNLIVRYDGSFEGFVEFNRTADVPRTLEFQTRQFAVDSGGPDILMGGCLFCIVAIHQNRISRSLALSLTNWADEWHELDLYPGAKTPSFAGPMGLAKSIATDAVRDVSYGDVWTALEKYDSKQFLAHCEMYRINSSSA